MVAVKICLEQEQARDLEGYGANKTTRIMKRKRRIPHVEAGSRYLERLCHGDLRRPLDIPGSDASRCSRSPAHSAPTVFIQHGRGDTLAAWRQRRGSKSCRPLHVLGRPFPSWSVQGEKIEAMVFFFVGKNRV